MLVPQNVAVTGSPPETSKDIPLPRPRPVEIVADVAITSSIGDRQSATPKPRP